MHIVPDQWVKYDGAAIFDHLVRAKTAAGVLNQMPYLPQWIEQVYEEQLKLEAVGASRIEGAEFTEREQDEALALSVPRSGRLTRSQRQLRSAISSYRWIREQPAERPVTAEFILNIHRFMVSGCDEDRREPGALRPDGWNVTFGFPPSRGSEEAPLVARFLVRLARVWVEHPQTDGHVTGEYDEQRVYERP